MLQYVALMFWTILKCRAVLFSNSARSNPTKPSSAPQTCETVLLLCIDKDVDDLGQTKQHIMLPLALLSLFSFILYPNVWLSLILDTSHFCIQYMTMIWVCLNMRWDTCKIAISGVRTNPKEKHPYKGLTYVKVWKLLKKELNNITLLWQQLTLGTRTQVKHSLLDCGPQAVSLLPRGLCTHVCDCVCPPFSRSS